MGRSDAELSPRDNDFDVLITHDLPSSRIDAGLLNDNEEPLASITRCLDSFNYFCVSLAIRNSDDNVRAPTCLEAFRTTPSVRMVLASWVSSLPPRSARGDCGPSGAMPSEENDETFGAPTEEDLGIVRPRFESRLSNPCPREAYVSARLDIVLLIDGRRLSFGTFFSLRN